jgi:hypothetical protein
MNIKKLFIQLLLIIGLSNILFAGTITRDRWVPIIVGDIMTFVPHSIVLSDKDGDGIEDALDTPTAYAQDITVDMNSDGYSIVLNGTDNDSAITYTIVTQPTHGVLSGTAPNLTYIPNNGFSGEDSFTFSVNDGVHTSSIVTVSISIKTHFGLAGTHDVSTYSEIDNGDSIVYYPSNIVHMPKTPLLFFAPGFQSQDHNSYKSLLSFIASHGYSVIYAKDYYGDPDTFISRFEKMLDANNDVLPYVDTTRIGVIGHSSGGGDTFKILDHFSKKGYGENGRFLMSLDGWFAFGMNSKDMKNLPSNTNIVMQRYHKSVQGDALDNTQDPRITLSEYALLTSIANDKKDYQVFSPATHSYPGGSKSYDQMQGLLRPLDALMDYTFNGNASAQEVALENGSDTPYADDLETIREKWRYSYRCDSHKNRSEVMEIDYCNQYLGGKNYPLNTIFDDKPNADPAQPTYLSSYVDSVFNNKVTRITDRANQTGNAHSYSKTQSWNADSSLIRLGYRIYYADNFSESPLTINTLLRGSLSEMKWSSYEPDVFYGMDVRWDRFVFMKAKINDDNTITYTDMPNATFMKSDYDEMKLGKYEGNLDYQDNYVVFSGRKKDTNRVTLMVYHLKDNYGTTYNNIESNVTTDMKWYTEDANGDFTTSSAQWNQMFDWASISALGNYVIVNYRSKKGDDEQEYSIEQYYRNIHHIRTLANAAAHGDLGVDANGKEVFVEFGFGSLNGESNLGIWMYPLDGSPRVQLLPDKYNGGHISCRNYQRPGWCYVNTRYLDTRDPDNVIGTREVFALKLDDSHEVERFAQTHNSTANSGLVMVNVSPDGTQVLFGSDWGDANVVMDTYHVKVGE